LSEAEFPVISLDMLHIPWLACCFQEGGWQLDPAFQHVSSKAVFSTFRAQLSNSVRRWRSKSRAAKMYTATRLRYATICMYSLLRVPSARSCILWDGYHAAKTGSIRQCHFRSLRPVIVALTMAVADAVAACIRYLVRQLHIGSQQQLRSSNDS
jgi:hypothetical protein